MGKPLDSSASFRPISLTSCVSKLFERIILSRLLFFLESNSILSPHQAGFRPGRSSLDQILFLSQSKPKPGSRTILALIDFSKAFESVWHYAFFFKLISAGLHPSFACWTRSFPSDRRACVVFLDKKKLLSSSSQKSQGSVLGRCTFSLSSSMIFRRLYLLPSAALYMLTTDDLYATLSSLSSFTQTTMGSRTLISTKKRPADELARRQALLVPSVILCSLSPLISRIRSSYFSD